jgi:hypothetical protein
MLTMDDSVATSVDKLNNSYKSLILWKPVQSGKTADSLDLAGMFFKTSVLIFIGDKNKTLDSQNQNRAKVKGFTVQTYMDKINLPMYLITTCGQKKVLSFMMEINQLNKLESILSVIKDVPITLIIDEADKSRSTSLAGTKKKKDSKVEEVEEEDDEVADAEEMPPVTKLLLRLKNLVRDRKDSRTIFVTATPMGVLSAEKDKWCVFYKEPYQNYTGVGLNHPANIHISNNIIRENNCKARDRWTGNMSDVMYNSFYPVLDTACNAMVELGTKDPSIKQLMLISLENRKSSQHKMAEKCREILSNIEGGSSIDVIVRNGDTAENPMPVDIKNSKANKIIIIAGFMASRGVSFTDFSDKENQYELVCQVHYTKPADKLNSSMQAMRIFGPARRTVSRPSIITNRQGIEDLQHNFMESYRIIRDIAEQCEQDRVCISSGSYNTSRDLTQEYNMRYLKQGNVGSRFIYSSLDPADHLPIE